MLGRFRLVSHVRLVASLVAQANSWSFKGIDIDFLLAANKLRSWLALTILILKRLQTLDAEIWVPRVGTALLLFCVSDHHKSAYFTNLNFLPGIIGSGWTRHISSAIGASCRWLVRFEWLLLKSLQIRLYSSRQRLGHVIRHRARNVTIRLRYLLGLLLHILLLVIGKESKIARVLIWISAQSSISMFEETAFILVLLFGSACAILYLLLLKACNLE